jgi:hypothetical protein
MARPVPEAERTPIAWRNACLDILRAEVHPAYDWNREATGRFIELARTDTNGLHVSYNFVRIRDEYYLGFALLFSRRLSSTLATPLLAGSRFDHNRTIGHLFSEDFGLSRGDAMYPPGVWSHNKWHSNTLALLVDGLQIPERHLYPRYLDALRAGKARIAALFERAAQICDQFDSESVTDEERRFARAGEIGLDIQSLGLLRTATFCDAFRLAGAALSPRYGSPVPVDFSRMSLDSIVANHLPDFYAERDQLLEYAKTARAL